MKYGSWMWERNWDEPRQLRSPTRVQYLVVNSWRGTSTQWDADKRAELHYDECGA